MTKRTRIQLTFEYFVDLCAMLAANFIAVKICGLINKIPPLSTETLIRYMLLAIISNTVIFVGFASSLNLSFRSRTAETLSVLRNCLLGYMVLAVLLLLTKNEIIESRYQFVISLILYIVISAIGRYILKRILIYRFSQSKLATLTGVVTVGERAEEFIERLQLDWVRRIEGLVLLDAVEENGVYKYQHSTKSLDESGNATVTYSKELETVREIAGVPVVANSDNFMEWIRSSSLDEVFLNIPFGIGPQTEEYIEELESMGITVHANIPMFERATDDDSYGNISCGVTAGYPMVTFSAAEHSVTLLAVKRIFDFICGIIGSVLSAPIILLVAIPLLIESKGPLIFKQPRIGKNGRVFNIYKLRSMYVDAEARKEALMAENKMNGFMFKIDDDPRITKVGRFIRKTSIDELPQFWNVVKGDMSLVGTRPPTVDEFVQYESHHKRRLSMNPGITGMWQVSGRSDIQDFEEVVKLDCKYIDNWSLWLDLKILLKTVKVVLTRKGAE